MYCVQKISVNSWNSDGSPVYDNFKYFQNWKELLYYFQINNQFIYGYGSDIFKDNEKIGHTGDFDWNIPIYKNTLKSFMNK